MDTRRFDDMVRNVASGASRRGMLGTGFGLLAAASLTALGAGSSDLAAAKKKRVKVCLAGETLQVRRKRRKFYLSIGATRGACSAAAPPNVPPPPPGCQTCGICEECSAGACQPKAAGSPCDDGKVCQGGECICPSAHTPCQELCCTECQRCDEGEADFLCIMEPGSNGNTCEDGTCCGGACCPGSCQCGLTGLAGGVASYVADFFDLPYPFCSKAGSGPLCGTGYPPCPADLTCRTISVVIGGVSSTIGVCVDLCPGVSYPSL